MIDRYTDAIMSGIWSEQTKYNNWLAIEQCVVNHVTSIPDYIVTDIQRLRLDQSLLEEIKDKEQEIKHDVLAFVEVMCQFLEEQRPGSSSCFHRGLTSSDLVDTGLAMNLNKAVAIILGEVYNCIKMISKRIDTVSYDSIVGRTHGQHTDYIQWAHKLGVYLNMLHRDAQRLTEVQKEVAVGKLSGPTGNYGFDVDFKLEHKILTQLGLRQEVTATQIVQRDRHAQLLSCLAILASNIEKITRDLWDLCRPEFDECEICLTGKGSSSMPHKVNPWKFETLWGLARNMRAFAQVGFETQITSHERDISNSSSERLTMPQATATIHYMLLSFQDVFGWIALNQTPKIYSGVNRSAVVLYELQKAGVPRNKAYDIVKKASRAVSSGSSNSMLVGLKMCGNEMVLSDAKLKEIFNEA
jgi:adenylosuccinate lyase